MGEQNRVVRPGATARSVMTDAGEQLTVPDDWTLLEPGDGPLTRLVKARGASWQVQVQVRNRLISKGIWAKEENILAARKELETKRSAPGYARKREQELRRRDKKQQAYREEFHAAVLSYLDFHPRYAAIAARLATAVTDFATPVGSGTVARTERIPVKDRARSAVIAWMRHQTTDYDTMTIARVKGRRRLVRRELADRAVVLLQAYRDGLAVTPACPLQQALPGQ